MLAVLGGLAFWLWRNSAPTSTVSDDSVFNVADTASVTRIFLADKSDLRITLDRHGETWMVNGQYTARPEAVSNLLSTLYLLDIKQHVPKAAYEHVIKNMATSSTKVEVYQGSDQPSKVFYVGSPVKEHTGTYMLMEGSERPYVIRKKGLVGFLNPYFTTQLGDWRNNDLYSYTQGQIAAVRVEHPANPEQSFEVRHIGNNQFELQALANGNIMADFDTAKAIDFMARFHRVPFEGFEETSWAEKRDSVTATPPQQVYTVTDVAGNQRSISTWLKPVSEGAIDWEDNVIFHDLERMVCVNAEDEYVVVQYHIFDLLAKELGYFRKD